jgi:putative membrane protein
MEADHSKATSELRALIVSKGLTVPGGLGPHLALKNRLDKLQGAAFDQAYMKAMVDDHVKDVHAFEMEAQTTKDADIKTFVEKTLPTLGEHLKMAQDTYKGVSSTMRTSSNAR